MSRSTLVFSVLALLVSVAVSCSCGRGAADGAALPSGSASSVAGDGRCPEVDPSTLESMPFGDVIVGSSPAAPSRLVVPLGSEGFLLLDRGTKTLSFPPPLTPRREQFAWVQTGPHAWLIIGGAKQLAEQSPPLDAMLYEDGKGWSSAGKLEELTKGAVATRLSSGDVLLTGGYMAYDRSSDVKRALRWRSRERRFVPEPPMLSARRGHAAAPLPGDRAIVVGGAGTSYVDASTELYEHELHSFRAGPSLPVPVGNPEATSSGNGEVIVAAEQGLFHLPAAATAWRTLSTSNHGTSRVAFLSECAALVTNEFSLEVWDLRSGKKAREIEPIVARRRPGVVRLEDGTVLIASGSPEPAGLTAEIVTRSPGPRAPRLVWRYLASRDAEPEELPRPLVLLGGVASPDSRRSAPLATSSSNDAILRVVEGGGGVRSGASLTWLGSRALLAGGQVTRQNAPETTKPRTASDVVGTTRLLDAASASWTKTGQPRRPRWDHTAVRLLDGTVALFGGNDGTRGILSVERWDPKTERFADAGMLDEPRVGHTTTLLADGSVLVVGGCDFNRILGTTTRDVVAAPRSSRSAELWEPRTRASRSMALEQPRCGHVAMRLADGRVLVAGGFDEGTQWSFGSAQFHSVNATTALWDPVSKRWTAGPSLNVGRGLAGATLLPDGRVLVVGGEDPASARSHYPTVEVYDPRTSAWSVVGMLPRLMKDPMVVLREGGKILVQSEEAAFELTLQ